MSRKRLFYYFFLQGEKLEQLCTIIKLNIEGSVQGTHIKQLDAVDLWESITDWRNIETIFVHIHKLVLIISN